MNTYSETEIHHLISRFEKHVLPKVEWTHEAHLVVAVWYSVHYSAEEALNLVRDLITKHNTSVGTPNTDSEGYHETITAYWLILARNYINSQRTSSIENLCNGFILSEQADSNYLLSFYSEELLFSVKARKQWVEPDLVKID